MRSRGKFVHNDEDLARKRRIRADTRDHLSQVCLQQSQCGVDTVYMTALIAVGSIDTGTDETMADVVAGTQGGLNVGAVEGVDIHGKIDVVGLGRAD